MAQRIEVKKKSIWKTAVSSTIAIGLCGTIFLGANNAAMALALDKEESIPTTYNISTTVINKADDYVKANYSVLENKIMPSTSASALPVDEAAEIGAQYLWNMFQTNLEGKTIYMSYFIDPSAAKAYWKGDIIETGSDISETTPTYSFVIEAISGKRVSISKRFEKKETTLHFSPQKATEKYRNNCDEYLQLAKQFTEKHSGIKAITAEFKDIAASIDGKSIPAGKSPSDADNVRAYEIFVVVIVTDEEGQQTEVTISTDSKNLQNINIIDPNRNNDNNYLG